MRNVTQLVGDALGIANDAINVAMGMSIDSVFNRAVGDEVKF